MVTNRRVSFQPAQVFDLEPASKEEIRDCWLSKQEIAWHQRDKKETLRALRKSRGDPSRLDEERYCTRGLEKYKSIRTGQQIRENQVVVLQVILDLQKDQQKMGISDEIGLRLAAKTASQWAVDRAQDQGRRDAEEAARIHSVHDSIIIKSKDGGSPPRTSLRIVKKHQAAAHVA